MGSGMNGTLKIEMVDTDESGSGGRQAYFISDRKTVEREG